MSYGAPCEQDVGEADPTLLLADCLFPSINRGLPKCRPHPTPSTPGHNRATLKSCIEQCLRADALPWELGELKVVVSDH